jgi:hypothetical protein
LQEKLDSLEKQKAVERPTNGVSQPQLEVKPTATNVFSEEFRLVSEPVDLQTSDTPTMECMTTQKDDEKAHESLNKVDNAVKLDLPQSSTDFHLVKETLVKNEEDTCNTAPEESQITPSEEETKSMDLLPETITGENYPEAELCQPQTENSQNVGSAKKNVYLNATEVVPSIARECCTSQRAPEVALSESRTAASTALSEYGMHDTSVTSSMTEKVHDPEDAPGVVMTDGIDTVATLPETKNLDGVEHKEDVCALATESNAREVTLEVTFSETTTKEVNLLEESHEIGGASVQNAKINTQTHPTSTLALSTE